MNSSLRKSFLNVALGAFLVAGCGVGEPIPVNLETAAGPCEYGQQFMTEGMMMVMKNGHVTVVPKDGEKQAFAAHAGEIGGDLPEICQGCH
jgi:hypothetical protein